MLTHLKAAINRVLRREDGQAIIELGIALPLIAALIVCLVDLGFGVSDQLGAAQLASQAARLAAVNSSELTAGVPTFVQGELNTTTLKTANVAVCFPPGPTGTTAQIGDPVTVSVTSSFQVAQFIPSVTLPVKGEATMRLEQLPSYGATGTC